MRLALLAPLWKTVPPLGYGGSELVVANLAKGLCSLGHEVTTFACRGSNVEGSLVEVLDRPLYELAGGFGWEGVKAHEFLSFFELGRRAKKFDVVHNHMGIHPIALAPLLPPVVTTLHSSLPPDFPYLADAFKGFPFVSISDAQRALAPALNYVATIHHGIDTGAFVPRADGTGSGFVFIGTLSYNKGIDIAVRTARELRVPLTIAGEVREEDRSFFETEVAPYVDNKLIRFVGEVGHEEKARLLRAADALLFPSRWKEAFGLVMIEALACGTPVVALGNGAVPEVIEHERTGFVADAESFAAEARRVAQISRVKCRIEAERRFDLSVMARKYVRVYELVGGSNSPSA